MVEEFSDTIEPLARIIAEWWSCETLNFLKRDKTLENIG
jgi:hypothetical protein